MNRLIVARYEEPLDWLTHLHGWQPLVVQKGKDLPNVGREASSWLWGLHKLYPKLNDGLVACVQGNPLDHCPNLVPDLERLTKQPPRGFTWLGDAGYSTCANGRPYHNGLTMGETRLAWLGQPWDGTVFFAAGGQFILPAILVKRLPRKFYGWLQQQVCSHPQGPWIMERLWEKLLGGTDAVRTAEGHRRGVRIERGEDAGVHRRRSGQGPLAPFGSAHLQAEPDSEQAQERVTRMSKDIAAQIEALGWQYSPNDGVGSPSARKMIEPGNCQDLSSNTPEQLLEAVRETERQMGAASA